MSAPLLPAPADLGLRERLADTGFHAHARAITPAGVTVRTQGELEESLEAVLRLHPNTQDLHVFGYGSLMWNPGMEHVGAVRGKVFGWHRSFCIHSLVGRGTPDHPGLMLALDRGGCCSGVVFRIAADRVLRELTLLWRREMTWGSYEARWVSVHGASGKPVRAITFVVDRRQQRYRGRLSAQESAFLIATGCGQLGSCRDYFDATVAQLRRLGIRDRGLEQLDALLPA